jgi:hypothetical protein
MKPRLLIGFLLIFLGTVFYSCAVTPVRPLEIGDKDAQRRVLIATQHSEFKDAVLSRVTDLLEQEGYFIRVVGLEDLAHQSGETYGAIVIINSYWFWQIDGEASDFIDRVDEKKQEKIILLTTVGEEIWNPGRGNVDTISSASLMSKVDSISEELIEKIQILVGPSPSEES